MFPIFIFVKGNTVQIKVARILASCACAMGLVLSLSAPTVQAQTTAPAAAPAAVSAAVSAPAPAVEVKKATEATDNPYGIESLWKTSDAVAKTVLLLLLVMSISSWYVLIVKLLNKPR